LNGHKIEEKRKIVNVRHDGIVRFDNSGVDVFEAATEN